MFADWRFQGVLSGTVSETHNVRGPASLMSWVEKVAVIQASTYEELLDFMCPLQKEKADATLLFLH